MRSIENKLRTLSVALGDRGLIVDAIAVKHIAKTASGAGVAAGGAVAGGAAVIGGSAALSAAIPAATTSGLLIGAAECTLLTGGVCGVVVGAVALLGAGLAYDWYTNSFNLLERFGGTDEDNIETLYKKWVEYTSGFDMIRGQGSFPKIDPDFNAGGQRTRRVETFFERFREKLDNNQTVTETEIQNWIKQDHGEGLLDWNTWGLDDEIYFVNSFNQIVKGKIAIEEQLAEDAAEKENERGQQVGSGPVSTEPSGESQPAPEPIFI